MVGSTTGFRLTARDVEIVRWIGRTRFAQANQVAARFTMDERNAYRRLRGLVSHGLLTHRRVFHAMPGIYTATRFGLATAEVRLPAARPDIRTYFHDLAAVDAHIELEHEFGPAIVRTERELRSHDAREPHRPRYSIRLSTGARPGLHFPDLAVELPGGKPLAIEVELTAKAPKRLDSIVRAYVLARHLHSVRYYAPPAVIAGVQRAVERARARTLFDIRTWSNNDDRYTLSGQRIRSVAA
jgi:hypothetical protein